MDKKSQQNDSASFEDAQDGEDQFEDCPDDQNSQEPNSPDKKITETNNKGKYLNSIEKVYNFQKKMVRLTINLFSRFRQRVVEKS